MLKLLHVVTAHTFSVATQFSRHIILLIPNDAIDQTHECLRKPLNQPSIAAAMETQPIQRSIAVILGPSNWTEWIRSIQRRAETLGIWRFVDPAGVEELQDPGYPEIKDIKPTAEKYSDLSEDEKEDLREQRA